MKTLGIECHYTKCYYAECCHAECRFAECRYAECRGAVTITENGIVINICITVTQS
jgi:hypothetical protein